MINGFELTANWNDTARSSDDKWYQMDDDEQDWEYYSYLAESEWEAQRDCALLEQYENERGESEK